ncbi:hypothetical protein C7B80_21820 [Cyanosarcina cf. burmensis CCALA 770]|nr:hypothetical protein C7B80_21820 [Cyanosarcina cf. burmensis CCALA 770]
MYDELKLSNSNTEICYDTTPTALPVPLPLWSPTLETHPQVVEFTYLMGAGMIRRWRSYPIAQPSLDDIFTDLSPTLAGKLDLLNNCGGSPLLRKLNRPEKSWDSAFGVTEARFGELVAGLEERQESVNLKKWMKDRAAELKDWCENSDPPDEVNTTGGALYCLQKNLACINEQMLEKLDSRDGTQESYFLELLTAGTATACQQLEIQKQALSNLITDYESARQDFLKDEVSAWDSFFTSCDALNKRGLFSRRDPSAVAEAVLRLRKVFAFSVSAMIYKAARHLLKNLALEIENQQSQVEQTDRILTKMLTWFEPDPEQITAADRKLQEDLCNRIDVLELRLQLEEKVGPMYEWHELKVYAKDSQDKHSPKICYLSEQLYEILNPICCDYYCHLHQAKDSHRWQPPKKSPKQVLQSPHFPS